VTETPVRKYGEAFISYGAHNNSKLYTEYGFTIPDNPHDFFPVSLHSIRDFLRQPHLSCQCWEEKVEILTKSHLAENLGISADDGLSWNLKAALRIACLEAAELANWHVVYQEESFSSSLNLLTDFTRFLLHQLGKSLMDMRAVTYATEHFKIAIELVASQVLLLEKTLVHMTARMEK
jgi:hypothetical protein